MVDTGAQTEKIQANVGIVSNGDAFIDTFLTRQLESLFTSVAAPRLPTEDIDHYVSNFDLVFLEANLGVAGGPLSFDRAFFDQHGQVKFCLFYLSGPDIATLNQPRNVIGEVRKPITPAALKKMAVRYQMGVLAAGDDPAFDSEFDGGSDIADIGSDRGSVGDLDDDGDLSTDVSESGSPTGIPEAGP